MSLIQICIFGSTSKDLSRFPNLQQWWSQDDALDLHIWKVVYFIFFFRLSFIFLLTNWMYYQLQNIVGLLKLIKHSLSVMMDPDSLRLSCSCVANFYVHSSEIWIYVQCNLSSKHLLLWQHCNWMGGKEEDGCLLWKRRSLVVRLDGERKQRWWRRASSVS